MRFLHVPLIAAVVMVVTGSIAAAVHAQTPSASAGSIANVSTPTPKSELPLVAPVDLQRYSGTWYEQARLPNRFQRKCVGQVSATYGALPDGRVSVLNRCVLEGGKVDDADGVARSVAVPGQPGAGRLQVSFTPRWLDWVPFVWGDYWILQLDADYRVSLVGTPSRKYLWVLSREPQLDNVRLQAALDYAATLGFDTRGITRTPSMPALTAAR